MQKILTVALFEGKIHSDLKQVVEKLKKFDDRIEIIYHLYGGTTAGGTTGAFTGLALDDYSKFVKVAATLAKGNYFICIDADCNVNEEQFAEFLNYLAGCRTNFVTFDKPALCAAYALKTSEVKKVVFDDGTTDGATVITSSVLLSAKTCDIFGAAPFIFKSACNYSYLTENFKRFENAVDRALVKFTEARNRLTPAVYKYAFDATCAATAKRYIGALYLKLCGKYEAEALENFDERLKEKNPFIYRGAEKLFVAGDLKKLRDKKFKKISFITTQKIKKTIKDKS